MLRKKSKTAHIWGVNIRKYRELHMISQCELAKKIRRSTMAISRYEDGAMPDTHVIDLIAKAFGIDIHELFIPAESKVWPVRKVAL